MNKVLLDWLLLRFPETPKARAKQWIAAGRVSVRGVIMRKPHERIPDPGDSLHLLERQSTSLDLNEEWRIHPRVGLIHLDGSLAIVNKGPGLISVPSGTGEISALSILADALAGRLKPTESPVGRQALPAAFRRLQPLPVHRLDKFTSGVFCVAMNPAARHMLLEELQAHRITREYVAFVEGRPEPSEGTWQHWLELSRDELQQQVIAEATSKDAPRNATLAVTHYRLLKTYLLSENNAVISKLQLRLESGLRHQIRVQAAAKGLPLVGDRIYNSHYRPPVFAGAPLPFSRQALHSQSIALEHPNQPGRRMSWETDLPKDLRQLEALLQHADR